MELDSKEIIQSIARYWNSIYFQTNIQEPVADVLLRNQHLLPVSGGKALDFACGLGENAIFLAEKGFEVHAWDLSEIALKNLAKSAQAKGLSITTQLCDVANQPLEKASFDVIIVSHFLIRRLIPTLIDALRPEGVIFYQAMINYTPRSEKNRVALKYGFGLNRNELLHLFNSLALCYYRENGGVGDVMYGLRSEVMLVGQKLAET